MSEHPSGPTPRGARARGADRRMPAALAGGLHGFRLALLLALSWLAGCGEVAATNPYDPSTPANQQAPGTLLLTLRLPAGFDTAAFEDTPSATLADPAEPPGAGTSVALTPAEDGTVFTARQGDVGPATTC